MRRITTTYAQIKSAPVPCAFCRVATDPNVTTPDGDPVCDACQGELCYLCEARIAETQHPVSEESICEACLESIGADAYDRAKDKDYG